MASGDNTSSRVISLGPALEKVVRPVHPIVQLRPDYPDQLSAPPPEPKSNLVTWGSAGDSVFQLKAHAEGKASEAKWPETDRKYDVVRVYSETDRDVFVDTEVMTEYNGKNKISQDRIQLRFAAPKDSKNTEVISRGNTRTNGDS